MNRKKTVAGICALAMAVSNFMGMSAFADEPEATTSATTTAVVTSESAPVSYFTIAAKWVGNNLRICWNKQDNATLYKISVKDTSVEGAKWESYKAVKGIGCYLTDLEQDHTYSICIMAIREDGESYKVVNSRIITALRDKTFEGATEGITVVTPAPEKQDDKTTENSTSTSTDVKQDENKQDENKQDEGKTDSANSDSTTEGAKDEKSDVVPAVVVDTTKDYKYNKGMTYTACDVNYVTTYTKGENALVELCDEHEVYDSKLYIPGNMTMVYVNERNGVSPSDGYAVKNYVRLGFEGTPAEFDTVKDAYVAKGVKFETASESDESYTKFADIVKERGDALNVYFAGKATYDDLTMYLFRDASGFVMVEYVGTGSMKSCVVALEALATQTFTDVYGVSNNVVMPSNVPCMAINEVYAKGLAKDRYMSATFYVTKEQAKAYFDSLEKANYMPSSAYDDKQPVFGATYYNTNKMTIYAQYSEASDGRGYLVITTEHKR